MSFTVGLRGCALTFIAAIAALAGCASGLNLWKPIVENAADERTKRERDLIEDFSSRRDDAQYQAALQSWESGDPKGCRELVEKVLQRNPRHKEARQLMADLHLDNGSPQMAQQILEQLLTEFPNDPQIHHSLGLLYETTNDTDAAVRHLGRAVELDPDNELYQTCHEMTLTKQHRLAGQ